LVEKKEFGHKIERVLRAGNNFGEGQGLRQKWAKKNFRRYQESKESRSGEPYIAFLDCNYLIVNCMISMDVFWACFLDCV